VGVFLQIFLPVPVFYLALLFVHAAYSMYLVNALWSSFFRYVNEVVYGYWKYTGNSL